MSDEGMSDENRTDEEVAVDPAADDDAVELDMDGDGEDIDAVLREALDAMDRREATGEENPGGDGSGEGGAAAGPVDVERLQAELAELRDRSVRTLADFDNYRKRMQRERAEERRYAGFEVLREVVAVVDNLERALSAGGSAEDLKTGVEMILRQMADLLRRHGVERVPAEGEPFDPSVHEAVSRQESDEVDEPTVANELQAGYMMHERLLRPAMVTVDMPGEPATTDAGSDDD